MMRFDNYNESLSADLLKLLNTNWEYDSISAEVLHEKMEGDPNWDKNLTFTAHNEDILCGFAMGVIREIRNVRYGYIKLMAVDKKFRRMKVATTLYQLIEKEFKNQNVKFVRLYDVPLNYFMPGIDPRYTPAVCMALKLGFKQFGESINMNVDLKNQSWETIEVEEQLLNQNIDIRRAQKNDLDEILKLIENDWPLWENEIKMAMSDTPPSLHIALLNGEIKAFSAYNANNKGVGWFGPMGTHNDLRNKGIGSVLLKRCLRDMCMQGFESCTIPWVGPISFYSNYTDAKINRVFWRFEKEL